jgi:FtsH-binding integral membrane protein
MAQSSAHGNMDIQDQKSTFHGFLTASVWTCGLIAQAVGLLTLAFAIGAGWWPGFVVFVAVGIAVGLVFKLPGSYWAAQAVLWIFLGLGGLIVPAVTGPAG